ncbi:MAG: hypothetical protein IJ250_07575, partial [Bacteroidales bacterium]|nr:hypothetical protein [Bacteroidales bacterium]
MAIDKYFVSLQFVKMNARKTVKTVAKRTAQVVLGLVVFVYLVVALLNTTVIQSFTAAGAAHYFSQQWHTKVSIGALSVTPFIHAGIKDIYVEDLHKDTLLYASYLEANLASMPKGSEVQVRNLELKDAVCNLVKRNGKFNFQFIIDYFASDKPKQKKESKPFGLKVNDILLKNVDFTLIDYEKQQPVIKGLFNPNRIICKDICLEAKSFSMLGMQMSADIINL